MIAAVAAGEGAAPGEQPAQGKKEKKAKKEGAEGAEGGKPKKEKGGGGGGKAPAEAEPITPGLVDMRVGRIVEGKHPVQSIYSPSKLINSLQYLQSRSIRTLTLCTLNKLTSARLSHVPLFLVSSITS